MGPTALFDKSFIQSLNIDESVWFDHFFICNICPIVFVETLSDLDKEMKNGKSPEEIVGSIAYKLPDMGMPNSFHNDICFGELHGAKVGMQGQILFNFGSFARKQDKIGLHVPQTPEQEALDRWSKKEFSEVEKLFAKNWRNQINALSLTELQSVVDNFPYDYSNAKTIAEVKNIVDKFVMDDNCVPLQISYITKLLNIKPAYFAHIFNAFEVNGRRAIGSFAPYTAFSISIDLTFIIGMKRGFISDQRNSNFSDISYLKYLPFSMIFISSDKLHRTLASLFLRENQMFVWGQDLKEDLKQINNYYLELPNEVKENGINYFASTPPPIKELLTNKIWERFLNYQTPTLGELVFHKPVKNRSYMNEMNEHEKAEATDMNSDDFDFIQIEHRVPKKKGSWYLLPIDTEE